MISSVNETAVAENQAAIWFLGSASFVLKLNGKIIYLDPYFSNWCEEISQGGPVVFKRLHPPVLQPESVTNADIILVSHDHEDHLDKKSFPSMMLSSPHAQAVLPHRCKRIAESWGVRSDAMHALDDGETIEFDGVQIEAVKSAHTSFEQADGGQRFLGYLIRGNGITIYFAGDSVVYDGMAERLLEAKVDIALLPIVGRDYFRTKLGIVGNMDYREAAELSVAIRAPMLIPYHYDAFTCHNENPGYLIDYLARYHPSQPCHVMARGEKLIWSR
ncbi:MBL fold metallo-hydrolase [Ferviditalea candida]|uniref:MBL fold metallo-hydrolase n=1 Tax=Ferviditalea candida TaxID=3108399 RepID=A0ABU5ZIY2_9BACL|nr:MBL fold metallo-hydrolase [Paenibacillaceae bacterium T2]